MKINGTNWEGLKNLIVEFENDDELKRVTYPDGGDICFRCKTTAPRILVILRLPEGTVVSEFISLPVDCC